MSKAEAEVKVAEAMIDRGRGEARSWTRPTSTLAEQALEEHTIRAPFDGVVIERMKNPGESVRANEAVVDLGNLDKLRVWAYVPLEYAYRVKEGQIVEIQPRLDRTRGGTRSRSRRRGSAARSPSSTRRSSPSAETAVRIYAEFENKDHELRPGLKAGMTIYLGPEDARRARRRRPHPPWGRAPTASPTVPR